MFGDLGGAAKYYQEALKVLQACGADGMNVTLYSYLGGVQTRLSDYTKAISTLEQGLVYAEQSGNVNLQFNLLLLLIDVHRKLVSPDMPELEPRNFILNQRKANEALQRYLEACRNLTRSYPALRSHMWDNFLWEESWDLKLAEEALKSAVENGDIALQIRANFFICGERLSPESLNRDDARAREAFEACRKCLKTLDSKNGHVVTAATEDMRLKLAGYARCLGELEEAEEILKILLRSYESMLDNMFMAGEGSDELVLKFQESKKTAIIAMMRIQLQLVDRDRNSRSNIIPNSQCLKSFSQAFWNRSTQLFKGANVVREV